MNFNLIHPETWISLNSKVHELLGLSSNVSVRVFQGVPHAAYELAMGTALFFSHKRSVGLIQGQTPAFQAVMPFLYKEGFQVQQLSQAKPGQPLTEWLKALKADNSFVMHTEDNPITGECFFNPEVDSILNEKKILSLRISHRRHLVQDSFLGTQEGNSELTPSSVQICEINPHLAVAICGSRLKSPVQIAAHFQWNEAQVLNEIQDLLTEARSMKTAVTKDLVLKFEAKLPEGFHSLLDGHGDRIFDRSLIYHPEIHGEALETELRRRLKLPDPLSIMSLTQCTRGFLDWSWWETKPANEVVRNLLVLDLKVLKYPDLQVALAESVQACRI